MALRFDHVNIVVTDLSAAETFFSELGFNRVQGSELDSDFLNKVTGLENPQARFVALALEGSGTTIELIEYAAPACESDAQVGAPHRPGIRHLAFAVDDIESIVKELESRGVKFISPIRCWEKTGKKLVYFYGPDGILLEFAQYPQGCAH